MLTIGELARASGVNLETIRYYERIGLMPQPPRTEGRHRLFDDDHRRRLVFIKRGRELGFSLEQIGQLLKLSGTDPEQPCTSVARLAATHLEDIRARVRDLTRLEAALTVALSHCATQTIATCSVLDMLAGPAE